MIIFRLFRQLPRAVAAFDGRVLRSVCVYSAVMILAAVVVKLLPVGFCSVVVEHAALGTLERIRKTAVDHVFER